MARTIAFHSNQLGLRGTEVSLYDYADHNETILGNRSVILASRNSRLHHPDALRRFQSRFPVYLYADEVEREAILESEQVEVFYCQKAGVNDGIVSRGRKTVVHCVFKDYEPHGDVYAYISDWLSRTMTGGSAPVVPYMVNLPPLSPSDCLRNQLGIPEDAIVFGRHGGWETFDLPFALETVCAVAARNPDKYFIFLNTCPFVTGLRNVMFLRPTADATLKVRFINTCDAMIHARVQGETFGLAVAEFSVRNKPVITWTGSDETAHLELLGDLALPYSSIGELEELLTTFTPEASRRWDAYSRRFNPEAVMAQFQEVFL